MGPIRPGKGKLWRLLTEPLTLLLLALAGLLLTIVLLVAISVRP